MTFSELYNMVFRFMRDTAQTKYDLPTVKTWINDAEQKYCSATGFSVKKDTSISTAAGTVEYALPSDCKSVVAAFIGSDRNPLIETDVENTQWDNATGTPCEFYVRNKHMGVYPTPTAVEAITLIYYSIGGDMSAADDVPIIPEEHHLALVHYACAQACIEGDDDRFQVFDAKWNDATETAKADVVKKSFSSFPVAGETGRFIPHAADRDWQGV